MMKKRLMISLIFCTIVQFSCSNDDDYIEVIEQENEEEIDELGLDESEELAGGTTTVFNTSSSAFNFPARNLANDKLTDFGVGNSLFNQSWVIAPASTTARDGLGPFYNSRACSGCHPTDGRGRTPSFTGELAHGLLLRLSIPELNEDGSSLGDPTYGGQFQDQAIFDNNPEGIFEIVYEEIPVLYPDGNTASLRKPTYNFTELYYGEMNGNVQVSPRVANQMIGLGLLDAIPSETLLGFADEFDDDKDGVSGKINYVYNIETENIDIGRFGWKANQPNLRQQVAGALSGDLGITSSVFPEENCTEGYDCDIYENGAGENGFEISEISLNRMAFYSATLAVPARRDYDDPDILEGKELFNNSKCIACHIPKITTGESSIDEVLENQVIYPYTDLLLHDMGDDLADNAPDFLATGNEWRTPPLWGIGLINIVNGHTELLHDARARNVEEAILWHGGESEASKNNFMNLTALERQKVIAFINSL